MTGIISGIKRMEIHDGDGLRTTVFFKGCPLKCVWCHNPESIGYEPQTAIFAEKCIKCGSCVKACPNKAIKLTDHIVKDNSLCNACFACEKVCPTGATVGYGRRVTVEELFNIVTQDEEFYKNGNGGVTLSGGECLTQPITIELAKRLKERGISVDIDTCGYVKRELLTEVMPYTDTFLYDIKAFDPEVHKRCTGHDNHIILENLKFLSESGCRIEIRYPFVVGYNDSECERIAEFLSGMKGICGIKVLKYHDLAASRYAALGMENTLPKALTSDEDVESARDVFRAHGIRVKE